MKAGPAMVGIGEKNKIQHKISLSRSPGNKFVRYFESKYDECCIFVCELFLTCTPHDEKTYLAHESFVSCNFIKKPANLLSRGSSAIATLELVKEYNAFRKTPLTEFVFTNILCCAIFKLQT